MANYMIQFWLCRRHIDGHLMAVTGLADYLVLDLLQELAISKIMGNSLAAQIIDANNIDVLHNLSEMTTMALHDRKPGQLEIKTRMNARRDMI